jgi:dihydroorotase
VLGVFLRLGLPLRDVIARVTANPARALRLTDRAGSLRPGAPADITVFRVIDEPVTLADCHSVTRTADRAVRPVMTFKNGVRVDADLERCQDEANWFMQVLDERWPAAAHTFSGRQRAFLRALIPELEGIDWHLESAKQQDIRTATRLQGAVHAAKDRTGLTLGEALATVYGSFIEQPFSIQVGLFLLRIERAFALERMREIGASSAVAV